MEVRQKTPQVWIQEQIARVKDKNPQFPKFDRSEQADAESSADYVLIFNRVLRFNEQNNLINITGMTIVDASTNRVLVTLPAQALTPMKPLLPDELTADPAPAEDAAPMTSEPVTPESDVDSAVTVQALGKVKASWTASRLPTPLVSATSRDRVFSLAYQGGILTVDQRAVLEKRGLLVSDNQAVDPDSTTSQDWKAIIEVTPARWEQWGFYPDAAPVAEIKPIPDCVINGLAFAVNLIGARGIRSEVLQLLANGYEDAAAWLADHMDRYEEALEAMHDRAIPITRDMPDSLDMPTVNPLAAELEAARQKIASLEKANELLERGIAQRETVKLNLVNDLTDFEARVGELTTELDTLRADLSYERQLNARLLTVNGKQSDMLYEAAQPGEIEDATLFIAVPTGQGISAGSFLQKVRADKWCIASEQIVVHNGVPCIVMRLWRPKVKSATIIDFAAQIDARGIVMDGDEDDRRDAAVAQIHQRVVDGAKIVRENMPASTPAPVVPLALGETA